MNPERINIKDLTIEEPEKEAEVFFDPEKDITEEDWDTILDFFKSRHYNPVEADELEILGKGNEVSPPNHFYYEKREELLKSNETTSERNHFLPQLLKNIAIKNHGINLSDQEKKEFKRIVKKLAESEFWIGYAEKLAWANIVGIKEPLDEKNLANILNSMKVQDEEWVKARNEEAGIHDWLKTAAHLKILGHSVPISKEQWQKFKAILDIDRADFPTNRKDTGIMYFLMDASNMKILSADEIEIPKQGGLELLMHKKETILSESKTIPEKRNF